jgi:glutathione S-transferase
MKLYLNNASPYARLVMVVAHEKQLAKQIELVWSDPWASEEPLLAVTPLAKVPVLIAEDGVPLLESGCICDYLDRVGAAPVLLPWDIHARLATVRKYGLGRGLIDVAFGAVIQKRYAPGGEVVLINRWRAAVSRTIAALEKDQTLGTSPDMGDLAIAVALSYIDFRLGDIKWRASAPRLSRWFDTIAARPSMKETAPGDVAKGA